MTEPGGLGFEQAKVVSFLFWDWEMKSILIVNARVVNEGRIVDADVFIDNGRIHKIGGNLTGQAADTVIEANGKSLIPGMIDDQVHFREPGFTYKGDIASESRAAVAGGITSYMDMPNTRPPTTTLDALEEKCQIAAQRSLANYSFYLGATNDNIDAIRRLDPRRACGIKVFMGASTGNMLVDRRETLQAIFAQAPVLIATHCEDTSTIIEHEHEYRRRYGEDVPIACHPLIRSEHACFKSSSLAVDLARKFGARLHVLHLSTARELQLLSDSRLDEKRITAEACVHHLFFDSSDYEDKGTLIKCNPAIKTRDDRDALRQAVLDNRIDIIGTDHAPHTLPEKHNNYFAAPAGLPLVQHALQSLLEHYHNGLFTLELIVGKTSHAVATLFQIKDRGFIREGYWADLVLVDLNRSYTVARDLVLSKCGWSPFEGETFRSSIDATIVSGHIAYQHGVVDDSVLGRRMEFDR